MADIRPFRALHYDPAAAGPPADLVAPPYDKISDDQAKHLRARSAHNCVRLILGEGSLDPAAPDNRYVRSAKALADWRERGVVVKSERPLLLRYEQRYELGGSELSRVGIIAAGRMHPFEEGVVRPHERTHRGPKVDRLELLKSTRANFGQIFMLYRDPAREVEGILRSAPGEPLFDLVDYQGVRNLLTPITDESIHARVHSFFVDQPVYIADGHHRYETALGYGRNERTTEAEASVDSAVHFGQWTLVNMDDPGLHVFATHRLLRDLPAPEAEHARERLEAHFEVSEVQGDLVAEAEALPRGEILLAQPERTPLRLRPKPEAHAELRRRLPESSEVVRSLDVCLLQELVLEEVFALGAQPGDPKRYLRYLRGADEAVEALTESGSVALALLAPTRVQDVAACADAGDVMPQKSTDFFPKILAGLSFLDLAEGETIVAPSE